jgi:hypothetical protein
MEIMSAGAVGSFSNMFFEGMIAVADLVQLISANRAGAGEDDGVPDLLLHDHFLDPGEKVGAEFEAKNHDAVELSLDRVNVGNRVAVSLGVVEGIGRGVRLFAACLLSVGQTGDDGERNDRKDEAARHGLII